MSDLNEGDKVRATLNGEVGFKVRATFSGELGFMDGDYAEVVTSGPLGYVVPLHLTEDGVSVVPADEPTPYERALTVLADKVADLEAASKRCDSGGRRSLAIEYRTEADAVRLALVGVIELDGVELDAAIVRAHTLIAEAVGRHG